ncbi:nuclear pore complex assembly-domain-containing protein [Pisolithus croceorrhizus]|nr:nuclear pore complex assembly-domain-containing protein [Pisolithus croceorrhizus]
MDVDDSDAVVYWSAFFAGGEFPWNEHKVSEIESRRARMADLLLFDVLLIRGGIRQPDMYYPPVDVSSLRRLIRVVDTSTYDALKKDCLVYILLKWYQDNRAARFLEDRCIPPQFSALADAYWHLDTGYHVAKAVSILSDARLNRDYVSKILQALALDDHPSPLVVKYVRTAKPLLTEPRDIDLYTLSLADLSFLDAWQYQRTFPESSSTRTRLLHKLLEWCLSPTPRAGPLAQLIGFPLSSFEQSQLTSYALNPPPSLPPHSVTVLQELVCVRLIQSADYVEAIKLDRQFVSVSGSSTKERKQLMDEIISTLSPAECWSLEAEVGQIATGVRVPLAPNSAIVQRERRLSGRPRVPLEELGMSWEEIQPNRPPTSLSALITSDRRTVGTPTPAALGPGRFDFGTTTSPLSTSQSSLISTPLVSRSSQQTSQPFAVLPPRQPTSVTPHVRPSGITLSAAHDIGSSARTIPPQVSLFEKMGSAKHIPNAFYKPPPQTRTSVGTMSPIPAPPSKPVKMDSATPKLVEEDVGMSSEGVPSEDENEREKGSDNLAEFLTHTKEADMTVLSADARDVPSPGFSVFGGSTTQRQAGRPNEMGLSGGQDNHTLLPSPARESVQEDKRRVPPGAFHDAEDESDKEPPSPQYIPRTRSNLPAARPPARSPPPQITHGRQKSKNGTLSQSIPGSLIDEDEEHETDVKEEEEDNVTPLPSSRPARKSRASSKPNSSKLAPQPKTPRRSSRLSTASLSPEGPDLSPPGPAKGTRRKSTRTTAAAPTVATRSSTRRKR